jgi:hypothetical protein
VCLVEEHLLQAGVGLVLRGDLQRVGERIRQVLIVRARIGEIKKIVNQTIQKTQASNYLPKNSQ